MSLAEDAIFIAVFVGGILGVFGFIYHVECSPPAKVTEIESASISGKVEGGFGLFGGTIDEEQYYFYYTRQGKGLVLEKSDASDTVIIEGTQNPRIKTHPCRTNELYVPRNTVILDYSVAQPGIKP